MVWSKIPDQKYSGLTIFPNVSLLVPIRNEVSRLSTLIQNLQKIHYPNLEIILIDDQSEDDSLELLEQLVGENPLFKIYSSDGVGKKAALKKGINQAKGEIIVTTDADCDFHPSWLETLLLPFQDSRIQLVAGPVLLRSSNTFLAYFQTLDWASIQLLTGVSFEMKSPLMCSGANLAFRKNAFEKVEGYIGNEHWLSGDDEFLLKKIVRKFGPESTCYMPSQKSLVTTEAEKNWQALFNQRIRWAGKWKAHESFFHAASAFLIVIFQLIWLGAFSLIFLKNWGFLWVFLIWVIKILAEFIFLGSITKFFKSPVPFWSFVLTSLWHPFYSVFIGLKAIRGNYQWKGRRIQGNVNFGNHGNDGR
ncbi:glycosyltransferase [Algoriphagus limi]|uniref:Glycosyltransferase n=1 Tax=Algoriphagus limi TaxID=2975273 RepID=A0ABT2GCQ3_9BACT|nr:glycosyltransferase [Algoriphagus limi]MCS5491755.1 glycosyltransferase [Algoriphagus limi]